METSTIRLRYLIVFSLTGVFSLALIIQFASVMLSAHKTADGAASHSSAVERGPILDRNGKILAIETRLNTVSIWSPNVTAPEETASLLGEVLNLPSQEILEKIRGSSDYAVIKRTVSPTETQKIKDLQAQNKLRGVTLQPAYGRSYPENSLASHLIGFVGVDNRGLSGAEYQFDKQLSPDPSGQNPAAAFGDQVFLTIDANAQFKMESLARKAYEEHDAKAVMLLAMNAKNGDLLAYAALPDFDPNKFDQASVESRRDFPVSYLYEPGSVFKMFSISSIFQLGGITENDYFNADGIYDKVSPPITDLGVYGRINAEGIIKYSSNVGASYASETVSRDNFYHMIRSFGFGEETGVELPGEEKGILRTPEFWTDRSKPSISFGQEISVTAMQMITAATAIANHGVLLKPHILQKIVSPDGRILMETKRDPVREVISPSIANKMISYMITATQPGGTAVRAFSQEYSIAAKTGTAEIWDNKAGTYSKTAFLASCMAMLPANDPQIIVYVVLDDPRKNGYLGGIIAAPIIREAAEYLGNYFGVPRKGDTTADSENRITIVRPQLPSFTDTLPDFTGLPKRILMPLFDRKDMTVDISGDGWVTSQSPAPGTRIVPGMKLRLELH
ncbi:MAG TPA: penicillin-binding protein [Spirochaetia bacterium]|nr:penicillin-binding protein [Spirochaetia bacterium]